MYQEFWTPKAINKPPYDHFTQIGDPVLRTKASKVPEDLITSKEVKVLLNPSMSVTNYQKHKHPEGCMSVRGYSAEVERYDSVSLKGTNLDGIEVNLELSGWNARIAQHEMDHLDGKLYIDIMDRSTFMCTCWEAVNSKSGRVEIPFYKK
ncbi:unnamed protein product [Ceratitis capitata]|uniref:Peptide deformylase n=1 Tax=Ceratitis capitata TaxID=7213 RepID=A0A811UB37_CERCA|nr:unnamed protein product [Ceratitis capitata]